MLLDCEICEAKTKCEAVGAFKNANPYDQTDILEYSFYKCLNCNSPLLISRRTIMVYDGLDWSNPKILYPPSTFNINKNLPPKLRDNLMEGIKCYKSGAYNASAIICRKVIELFCKEKEVSEYNLDKALKKLVELNQINSELYEWANQLRIIGNNAAHDFSNLKQEDAKDILDFTIAILDYSYLFRQRFEEFQYRHIK